MKFDAKHLWKTRKKMILGIAAGVVAAVVGCTVWYQAGHSRKKPVYVFPFEYVGMTEYWGDVQESNGPVTTDKIQTVFLSDTQTVTKILVAVGDEVKRGDLLMTFDTTLSDLKLERKRLDVEKLKLHLEDAKAHLKAINGMKPMVLPDSSGDTGESENTNQGTMLTSAYKISSQTTYDGSSAEKALICWIRDDTNIDDAIFAAVQEAAERYQAENEPDPTEPSDETESTEPEDTTDPTEPETPSAPTRPQWPENPWPNGQGWPFGQSSASAATTPADGSFHVVFKVTAGNMSLGAKEIWQGMKVKKTESGYSFALETALIPDHMMVELGGDDTSADSPQIDYGSGYTAAQIAQLRSEQQKKIRELEFQIKMTNAEYKIMQTEVSDGNIYAQIDGQAISVLTEEEAKQTSQPIIKISGGGGFYVEGFISELEKDNVKSGQEVTVSDWNTGMTYTGKVITVGDFPSQSAYYNGSGNPNASYYPFRVFIDGEADLQEGRYVSIRYSNAESQNGIYLENPFLRKEKGKSYVLVLGTNGKLEQRYVITGKSLWGNYTEILEGLQADDLIAFPYGKNVRPGVAAVKGDRSNLYG